jgi:hypothetical protein
MEETFVDRARRQAIDQAETWLRAARRVVDAECGVGAADKEPALVAAMLSAMALDNHAMVLLNALEQHGSDLDSLAGRLK